MAQADDNLAKMALRAIKHRTGDVSDQEHAGLPGFAAWRALTPAERETLKDIARKDNEFYNIMSKRRLMAVADGLTPGYYEFLERRRNRSALVNMDLYRMSIGKWDAEYPAEGGRRRTRRGRKSRRKHSRRKHI